jgi:hypothetical protein
MLVRDARKLVIEKHQLETQTISTVSEGFDCTELARIGVSETEAECVSLRQAQLLPIVPLENTSF